MSTLLRRLAGLAVALFVSLPIGAMAQDDGLYDAPVDPNSAFVRVLLPGASAAMIDGSTVSELTNGLSPYVNVEPGDIAVTVGEYSGTVTAASGGYYTLAFDGSGTPVTFKDDVVSDPAKAGVYFYNLTATPDADLYVPSAKVNAIEKVPAGGAKSVALKAPLTLDVEFKAAGETLATIAGLDLKRRGGVAVVLSGVAPPYTANFTENTFYRAQ